MNKALIEIYLQLARRLALVGGEKLLHYWGRLSDIKEKKYPGDLVTEADSASEEAIIQILEREFPSHRILAEESGLQGAEQSEFLWAIDPLDGTTNYTHQFPFVAVSIALLYQGTPLVCAVYNPIMRELFYAGRTLGAYLNDKQLMVSQVSTLDKSLLATGFSYRRRETEDNNFREFYHLTNISQGVRRAGSASLDLAYVAAGRFDGYWENDLSPWDIAGGALLVEEAGGIVSSFDKTALDYMKPKILATNGLLHDALSQALVG